MAKRSLDDTDRKLIALLRANARTPTAALARSLGLSRSAVQERLRRLERDGVIRGYTLILGDEAARGGVSAHVLLTLDPKQQDRALAAIKGLPEATAAYSASGTHDAIVMLTAETSAHLDEVLNRIGKMPGVNRTTSAILLSTLFERS
ncbi:MAG TPA: Lrp/AsnC family transcriptional regulator [Dongiaceae bacterium]|jgi:DNA-binding Lrp family transcriptional regulator|nr:Lrp/AsnC family transcriptional regulator [Dongiaceae bacterium]